MLQSYLRPASGAERNRSGRMANHYRSRPLKDQPVDDSVLMNTTAVWFNGTLLTCCGMTRRGLTNQVRFLPVFGDAETGWTFCESYDAEYIGAPAPRQGAAVVTFRGRVVMIGGVDASGACIPDAWLLITEPNRRQWQPIKLQGIEQLTAHFAWCELTEGVLLLHGGRDATGAISHSLLVIDLYSYTVLRVGETPSGPSSAAALLRHTMALVSPSEGVLLYGGQSDIVDVNESVTLVAVDVSAYVVDRFETKSTKRRSGATSPVAVRCFTLCEEAPAEYTPEYPYYFDPVIRCLVWPGPTSAWALRVPSIPVPPTRQLPPRAKPPHHRSAAAIAQQQSAAAASRSTSGGGYDSDFSSASNSRGESPASPSTPPTVSRTPSPSPPSPPNRPAEEAVEAPVAPLPTPPTQQLRAEWELLRRQRSGVPPCHHAVTCVRDGTFYLVVYDEDDTAHTAQSRHHQQARTESPPAPLRNRSLSTSPVEQEACQPSMLIDLSTDQLSEPGTPVGLSHTPSPFRGGHLATYTLKAGWTLRPVTSNVQLLTLPPPARPPSIPKSIGGRPIFSGSTTSTALTLREAPNDQSVSSRVPLLPNPSSSAGDPRPGTSGSSRQPSTARSSQHSDRHRAALLKPQPPPSYLVEAHRNPPLGRSLSPSNLSASTVVALPSPKRAAVDGRAKGRTPRTVSKAMRDVAVLSVAALTAAKPAIRSRDNHARRAITVIHAAAQNGHCQIFDLSHCHVACEDLFVLREALTKLQRFTTVDVSNQSFNAFETEFLVDIALSAPQLCVLRINQTLLQPPCRGGIMLEAAVRSNIEQGETIAFAAILRKHDRRLKVDARLRRRLWKVQQEQEAAKMAFVHTELVARYHVAAREERSRFVLECEAMCHNAGVHAVEALHDIVTECRLVSRLRRAIEVLDQHELTSRENEKRVEGKAWTDLQRVERTELRMIADAARQLRKALKVEREEMEKVERAYRNEIKQDEDRLRQPLTQERRAYTVECQRIIDEEKRAEDARRRRLKEEEDARIRAAEREREEREEVARQHKNQQDLFKTKEEQARGVILTEQRTWNKKLEKSIVEERNAIKRHDNFMLRSAKRAECDPVPPIIAVSSMPSSSRVVRGNCTPTVMTKVGHAELEPVIQVTLGRFPDYFGDLKDISTERTLTRKEQAAIASLGLEPGEITPDQYISRKSAVIGGTLKIAIVSTRDEPGLYLTVQRDDWTLVGDLSAEHHAVVRDANGTDIAELSWEPHLSTLVATLLPGGCSAATVCALLGTIALEQRKRAHASPSPPSPAHDDVASRGRASSISLDTPADGSVLTLDFGLADRALSPTVEEPEQSVLHLEYHLTLLFPDCSHDDVKLESYWKHSIEVQVYSPIVVLGSKGGPASPHSAATGTAPIYTEGEGEVSFWSHLVVNDLGSTHSLQGASLIIRIANDCDPGDALVLRSTPGARVTVTTSASHTRVFCDTEHVADVVQMGPLQVVQSAPPGQPQPELKPNRSRKIGVDDTVVFKLHRNATREAVERVLKSVTYANLVRNPVEGTRRVHLGLIFATGLKSTVQSEFIVVAVDDPTVIDFGVPYIPYRKHPAQYSIFDDFVSPQPCAFASHCTLFDVDTTTFEGGSLKVTLTNPVRGDYLSCESSHDIEIIDTEDAKSKIVTYRRTEIGTLEATSNTQLEVKFGSSSIEATEAIFKALTFSTPATGTTSNANRIIVFNLICGDAVPVHSSCTIRMAEALAMIAAPFWTYKEKSDLMPVATFAVCHEDEGWDGGYITAEIVHGLDPDDTLVFREADGLKLVDESAIAAAAAATAAAQFNLSSSPRQLLTALKAPTRSTTPKPPSMPLTPLTPFQGTPDSKAFAPPSKGGDSEPSSLASTRTTSDMKTLWRTKAAEKVRQLAQARQRTHDDLRSKVLEQIRTNRKGTITSKVDRTLYLNDVKIGSVSMYPGGLSITFIEQAKTDPAKPRSGLCQLHRKDIEKVLRNVCYKSVSDNPEPDSYKIVKIVLNDGLPHSTTLCTKIMIEPIDDVTEMRRLNNEPRKFRHQSFEDNAGFALFDDVTLHDPDTFAFNGSVLKVELIGGGDPRTDSVALLTVAQQESRGVGPNEMLRYLPQTDQLVMGPEQRVIGTAAIEPPSSASPGSVTITFAPYPTGPDVRPYPRSHDDAAENPHAITILMVERALHAIAFTSTATVAKPGMRIYQAHLHVDNNDTRLKVWIDVQPPLLVVPEYGAELQYREGRPPTLVFSKASLNFDAKIAIRKGYVAASIASGVQEDADKLELVFGKSGLGITKGNQLYNNKEYVGIIDAGDHHITLTFDWASKVTSKTVQAFIRCLAFSNNSQDPTTDARKVEVVVSLENDSNAAKAVASISVIAEDNPTEIALQVPKIEVVREGPAVGLCEGAVVTDPDSEFFYQPTYISATVIGGVVGVDVLWLRGLSTEETIIYADLDAPPVPPPPPTVGSTATFDSKPSFLVPNSPTSASDPTVDMSSDMAQPRIVAIVERVDKKASIIVKVMSCSLAELGDLVRRLNLKCLSSAKDKAAKKTVAIEIKSGTAPVFRVSVGVDILPTLIEIPSAVQVNGIPYKGVPTEPFGTATVSASHCEQGAILTIGIGDKTDEELVTTPFVLTITNKQGMSLKENTPAPPQTKSSNKLTAAPAPNAAAGVALMLDGKRVGTVHLTAKYKIVAKLPGANAASLAQKLLRSITVQSILELRDEVVVQTTLNDLARSLEYTTSVLVAPPDVLPKAMKRMRALLAASFVASELGKSGASQ